MSRQLFVSSPLAYGTTNVPVAFDLSDGITVDATNGYGGGPALTGSSLTAFGIKYFQPLPDDDSNLLLGMRFKASAFPASSKVVLGGVDASGALIVCLALLATGQLAAYRGNLDTLLAVSPSAIATATQLRIGLKTTLGAGASGAVEIHVNGVAVVTVNGTDPGAAAWRGFYVGAGPSIYLSHIYGRDGGSLTPGVLCKLRLSTNVALDDPDPDGDTTTADLAAVGDQVTSAIAADTDHRTIYGIQTVAVVKGTGGVSPLVITDGTTYTRDRQALDPVAYKSIERFEALNPKTGLPWTSADVTALQLGVKAVA